MTNISTVRPHAVKFGAVIRPMRNGKPLLDWDEIQRLQDNGKLPRSEANASLPGREGNYIVTPPDTDAFLASTDVFSFLRQNGKDVEV